METEIMEEVVEVTSSLSDKVKIGGAVVLTGVVLLGVYKLRKATKKNTEELDEEDVVYTELVEEDLKN